MHAVLSARTNTVSSGKEMEYCGPLASCQRLELVAVRCPSARERPNHTKQSTTVAASRPVAQSASGEGGARLEQRVDEGGNGRPLGQQDEPAEQGHRNDEPWLIPCR